MVMVMITVMMLITNCNVIHTVCCICVFSSSGYCTPASDYGVMSPTVTNSQFAGMQGQHVSLYSHQPSSTVQWKPHASAAGHSAAWSSNSQFPQVSCHGFY